MLTPPVIGAFTDGRGEFFGDDLADGHPVQVRFIWSEITPSSARWDQAYWDIAKQRWETNWIMEFTRAPPEPDTTLAPDRKPVRGQRWD